MLTSCYRTEAKQLAAQQQTRPLHLVDDLASSTNIMASGKEALQQLHPVPVAGAGQPTTLSPLHLYMTTTESGAQQTANRQIMLSTV